MKKLLFSVLASFVAIAASAELPDISKSVFEKGDRLVNFSIGVGSMSAPSLVFVPGVGNNYVNFGSNSSATFDQHFGMEWCVFDGWIDNRASLGFGFSVDNSAFGKFQEYMVGEYNYRYALMTYSTIGGGNRKGWSVSEYKQREGYGTTFAHVKQDNLAFLATCSFHFQFIDKLDTYAILGFGFAVNFRSYDYYNAQGFEQKDFSGEYLRFSYNDYDHVNWITGSGGTGASFAMSSLVGARYYFQDNLAAKIELGMIGGAITGYGNSAGIFSIGVTYKL